ncbi:hypothetical protein SETIT_4G112900v2 [Setaria italica]|uniref:Uncharacterized protein n=1 Tax=Setaria italica TaxID=4555 RepID=A0A368QT43_SETIT|nr:hypothetical protein SETIT_4G112900v2 [Setaria italica]
MGGDMQLCTASTSFFPLQQPPLPLFLARGHATKVCVVLTWGTALGGNLRIAEVSVANLECQVHFANRLDGDDLIQAGLSPPRCQHSLVSNWFVVALDSLSRSGCPWRWAGSAIFFVLVFSFSFSCVECVCAEIVILCISLSPPT